MMRLVSRVGKLLVVLALTAVCTGSASSASDSLKALPQEARCQALLTNTVDVDFSLINDGELEAQAVAILMQASEVIFRFRPRNTAVRFREPDSSLALWRLGRLIFSKIRRFIYSAHGPRGQTDLARQVDTVLDRLPDISQTEFYERRLSAEVYQARYSDMQQLFASLMLGYGLVQSDIDVTKKLIALDLGAGVGDSTVVLRELLPNAEVHAIDRSRPMLAQLHERMPEVASVEMDFAKTPLPFADGSVDVISSMCAAGQYLDPLQFDGLLLELKRVLAPGGYFIMEYGAEGHTKAARPGESLDEFKQNLRMHGLEPLTGPGMKLRIKGHDYHAIVARKA